MGNKKESNGKLENGYNANYPEEKLKYPKSIFFIFSNEFCERFSYYGMRTILALYLQSGLGYSEDLSTVIYHVFVMLCYFTPLIGGIIADSWLGKFKTIFYVSIIYAIGNITLSVGSYPGHNIPHAALSLLGLFLIASGTGGIKPCVSSFGGDQFVVPQQQRQLESFFSVFYFSINAGSVLSCFFTPMLREVKCLGQDTCYPLAFGVPAVLMILSIVFFVLGKPMYKINKAEGKNIAVEVFKCCTHAVARKVRSSGTEEKKHWLDYADDRFSLRLIEDTKILMKIIYLFAPTIIFWSLYEQQGSRWTFQASHMDGRIGSFVLQPDQMQTLNPILCLLFIPIFEGAVYPICYKLRIIRSPLQKLSWGGFIAAVAFVMSGVVQLYMQASYPVFPQAGEAQLRVFSDLGCEARLSGPGLDLAAPPLGLLQRLDVPVQRGTRRLPVSASACNLSWTGHLHLTAEKAASYLMYKENDKLDLFPLELKGYKELDKLESGNPKLKVISGAEQGVEVVLRSSTETHSYRLDQSHQTAWKTDISTGKYVVSLNGHSASKEANLEPGGVYVLMTTPNLMDYKLFTITPANNISMLWQVPQYFVITFAEIMFSITGMEFSFTQSPDSMKSVMSSIWLITDAFGNLIVLIVAGLKIFDNEAYEFFLYAALMAAVMVIFVILAMRYTYVTFPTEAEEKEKNEKGKTGRT